jgi:hypothetical protein
MLRITGFALMGGVTIQTRLPGESRRQAKRRVKAEQKARNKLEGRKRKALRSGDD